MHDTNESQVTTQQEAAAPLLTIVASNRDDYRATLTLISNQRAQDQNGLEHFGDFYLTNDAQEEPAADLPQHQQLPPATEAPNPGSESNASNTKGEADKNRPATPEEEFARENNLELVSREKDGKIEYSYYAPTAHNKHELVIATNDLKEAAKAVEQYTAERIKALGERVRLESDHRLTTGAA